MLSKHALLIYTVFALLLLTLAAGCGPAGPRPIKEGVLWRVVWTDGESKTSLSRGKIPEQAAGSGEYGVDMYGVLYPTCLEVRFRGLQNGRTIIIPFRQINSIEFGSDKLKVGG